MKHVPTFAIEKVKAAFKERERERERERETERDRDRASECLTATDKSREEN